MSRLKTKKMLIWLLVAIVLVAIVVLAWPKHQNKQSVNAGSSATSKSATTNNPTTFNKSAQSTTSPTSYWVVVNKQHPLNPKSYAPADLVVPTVPLRVPGSESMQMRAQAAKALETMFAAAKSDGLNLQLSSGYRPYGYQVSLYNGYLKTDPNGAAGVDKYSARPGYSEHQTGLAADLEPVSKNCELQACFADTPEGKWLAANAYKYGFILRYTADKTLITGYETPEPWHYRYVGTDLAKEMHNQRIETLEEFFGISGGPNY